MKQFIIGYTNAYRGLKPAAWWLALVMLVNRMGTMVLPFMTLYMTEHMDVSIAKAGLVITIFGVGTICGGFLGGKLTDLIGFYKVQLIALLGGGTLFIVLGQMDTYISICITTFFLSLVNELFRPANAAAIAHFSDEKNRTRSLTLNRLAINLGWAVGGTIGGFVAAHSYHLLFWIDGFTNIGAAVLLWLFLSPSKLKVANDAKKDNGKEAIIQSAYKDMPYLLFILLNTIFACCFFQIFTTIPVYFKQELLLSEQSIGIVMALNGLICVLFEMMIIHNLDGKRSLMTYVAAGSFLVGIGFIVLNIVPGLMSLAVIFISLITVGEIINMPFAATFWMNRSNERNRGQYAGLFTISWAVAQIIGPWSGAKIADTYGFDILWWILGGVSILSVLGYRWVHTMSAAETSEPAATS